MASRLKLHEELISILGNVNVYYQPPANVKLQYPCVKYSLSGSSIKRANNGVYNHANRYEVIVVDPNPDSCIHETILQHLPLCNLDRGYTADNLNHFVLTLYY